MYKESKTGNSFTPSYGQAGVQPIPGKLGSNMWWFGKTNTVSPNATSFFLRGSRQRIWDWSWRVGIVFISHYPTLTVTKNYFPQIYAGFFAVDNNWWIIFSSLSWPTSFSLHFSPPIQRQVSRWALGVQPRSVHQNPTEVPTSNKEFSFQQRC